MGRGDNEIVCKGQGSIKSLVAKPTLKEIYT